MTSIAIVTPWLDHPELAEAYLHAVSITRVGDEVIVVDNGSRVPRSFARIKLDRNHGFAAASNLGLHEAATDAVLFLNNDVVMADHSWLERFRSSLEPGVLVGARLCEAAPHAAIDGVSFPYLEGWCLGGMRDDLLELGGFDEAYEEPSYYGDNDLCLRARLAGMALREVRVGLRHIVNVTAGPGSDPQVAAATRANYERYAARAREALQVTA